MLPRGTPESPYENRQKSRPHEKSNILTSKAPHCVTNNRLWLLIFRNFTRLYRMPFILQN